MSKLIMFDFLCPEHGLFDDLVKPDIRQIPCPKCGHHAERQISPVRIDRYGIAMSGSASPESLKYFDHVHRQQKAIEERNEREHGDYGKAPGSD